MKTRIIFLIIIGLNLTQSKAQKNLNDKNFVYFRNYSNKQINIKDIFSDSLTKFINRAYSSGVFIDFPPLLSNQRLFHVYWWYVKYNNEFIAWNAFRPYRNIHDVANYFMGINGDCDAVLYNPKDSSQAHICYTSQTIVNNYKRKFGLIDDMGCYINNVCYSMLSNADRKTIFQYYYSRW